MSRIVLGFNVPGNSAIAIKDSLGQYGVEVEEFEQCLSKISVNKTIEDIKADAVICQYDLEQRSVYSIDDFEKMRTEFEGCVVIPILPDSFKGTEYMEGLLNLGVTGALFNANGDIKNIADVIKNSGRSRAESKVYYGLNLASGVEKNGDERLETVNPESMIRFICNEREEGSYIDRALYVKEKVPEEDFAVLIRQISDEVKTVLIESKKFDLYFSKEALERDKKEEAEKQKVLKKEKPVKVKEEQPLKRNPEKMPPPEKTEDIMLFSNMPGVVVEIGVGSAVRGSGCTSIALAIAKYLSNRKFKVAVVEQNSKGDFGNIYNAFVNKGENTVKIPVFKYEGIDCFPYCKYSQFAASYKHRYDYVIVDFGCEYNCSDFFAMTKKIITMSVNEWNYKPLKEFLNVFKCESAVNYLVTFADNRWLELKKEVFLKKQDTINPIKYFDSWKESGSCVDEIIRIIFQN